MKTTCSALLLVIGLTGLLVSCTSDNDSEFMPPPEGGDSGISMLLKVTGGSETEYGIVSNNIMEGTVSAVGNGIETLDWNYVYHVGKSIFSLGSSNRQTNVFQEDMDGVIREVAKFNSQSELEIFGNVNNTTMLAIDAPRDGSHSKRKLYSIDAESGFVASIQEISIFDYDTGTPGDGLSAYPSSLQVVDDKLFISYNLVDDIGMYTTPAPNKAYVAIYSYPEVESAPIKIIEDDRTSNIGTNGFSSGLIQTENGTLYSYSCGAEMAGFSPAATKPSGILRINTGETEFDDSYFFDIEAEENGGKIFWFDYVGNNKAIARILTSDDGGPWEAYGRSTFNQKLVLIDLNEKSVTDISNVPLHAKRYTGTVTVMDNKVYTSIETATEAYVYEVDLATAEGTKGALIEGKTIKSFFKL